MEASNSEDLEEYSNSEDLEEYEVIEKLVNELRVYVDNKPHCRHSHCMCLITLDGNEFTPIKSCLSVRISSFAFY